MKHFYKRLSLTWSEPAGIKEVLTLALPLILSTSAWSLQNFVDRMFLSWHSQEAMAAAMPASLLSFTFACLFIGIATMVNTFVAQYCGSNQLKRVGPIVWQGVYLGLFSSVLIVPLFYCSPYIFAYFNHGETVEALENIYFSYTLIGVPFIVMFNALSSFFSGLGKTITIMWVNFVFTGTNLLLDYLMIFGKWGFPEMGIKGAAIATVLATIFAFFILLILFLNQEFKKRYGTHHYKFNLKMFYLLFRFGFPNGLQMFTEIGAFTAFFFYVGSLGIVELSASNIAININTLAFMPMFGMMIAVSALVGQYLGSQRTDLAEKATFTAFKIAFSFFTFIGLIYVCLPGPLIYPFIAFADPERFQAVETLTIILLRFVAIYCLFDAIIFIFSGALRGAGDTRFIAWACTLSAWLIMVVPSALSVMYLNQPIFYLWGYLTLYTAIYGGALYFRFRYGPWRKIQLSDMQT